MIKKRLRLKKWVVEMLVYSILSTLLILGMYLIILNYQKVAEDCDKHLGRTCTIYEINKYVKGVI